MRSQNLVFHHILVLAQLLEANLGLDSLASTTSLCVQRMLCIVWPRLQSFREEKIQFVQARKPCPNCYPNNLGTIAHDTWNAIPRRT